VVALACVAVHTLALVGVAAVVVGTDASVAGKAVRS
jgi:hypothetical protein